MTWNHRVVHQSVGGEDFYGIHEVFYDDEGKANMVTQEAVGAWGDDIPGLQETLEWMHNALDKPILEYDDFFPGAS